MTFEQMQQFRAEIDGRIAEAQANSAASFQTAALQNRSEIATAVETKFAAVETKFSELSERVMGLFGEQKTRMDLIATKVLADAKEFDEKMKDMTERIGAVSFDNLVRVGGDVANLKAEFDIKRTELQTLFLQSIGQTAGELMRLEQKIPPWIDEDFVRSTVGSIKELREFATTVSAGGLRVGGGGGGPRLRVPDPSGWSMATLKNGNDDFKGWRESLETQVGSIWLGLDRMMELIREKSQVVVPFTQVVYEELLCKAYPVNPQTGVRDLPLGSNNADWSYEFVSRKLYMVVHGYSGADPRKIIEECNDKCGFDAYRLLVKEYDPVSSDTEYHLQDRVMAIAKWSIKNLSEEHAALREASLRIAAFEKRMGKMGPDQMRMITGMLYSNVLSPSTKKFVLARPAKLVRDADTQEEKLVAARDDFKEMRAAVEELVNIEVRTRPQKMDVSSMEAAIASEYTHEEWLEYWLHGDDQEAEDSVWADSSSSPGSLDAVGKGKGKGKGKGAKGKGWDKGKGKGKGWEREKGWGKGKGNTEWVERRACHNCNEVGHIARDCKQPAKARTMSHAEEAANRSMPPAVGAIASSIAARPTVGRLSSVVVWPKF